MRILVVEDERRMAELLRQGLTEEGHTVTVLCDGNVGLAAAECYSFDLIILDVMLPGISGLEVAQRLRARRNQTPILMLTARDSTEDVVKGLNIGADDYITKPFSFEILVARVNAVSRRGPIPRPVLMRAGGITVNQATRDVWRGSQKVELTRTQFALLEVLMRDAGRVVTRESLINGVWGSNSDIESNTLDVFVRALRAKLHAPGNPSIIRTVRGVGYSIDAEIE